MSSLRDQLAETVTDWALMYPLANWPPFGRIGTLDDQEHLDAIAKKLAATWGDDLADKLMAVVQAEAARGGSEHDGLRDQVEEAIRRIGLARNLASYSSVAWVVVQPVLDANAAEIERLKKDLHRADAKAALREAVREDVETDMETLSDERDEAEERAKAAEAERDRLKAAIQQIREAKRGLDAAIIASAHRLDEPFTDQPEMSPWKVCKVRMKALDDAVKAALGQPQGEGQ